MVIEPFENVTTLDMDKGEDDEWAWSLLDLVEGEVLVVSVFKEEIRASNIAYIEDIATRIWSRVSSFKEAEMIWLAHFLREGFNEPLMVRTPHLGLSKVEFTLERNFTTKASDKMSGESLK